MRDFKIQHRVEGKDEVLPVRVCDWEDADTYVMRNLIDPDQIVAPYQNIVLIYNFPLENETARKFKALNPKGFTRKDFYECIFGGYLGIYTEEEEASLGGVVKGPYGVDFNYDFEGLIVENIIENEPSEYELQITYEIQE